MFTRLWLPNPIPAGGAFSVTCMPAWKLTTPANIGRGGRWTKGDSYLTDAERGFRTEDAALNDAVERLNGVSLVV